jgi:hypothetical protein
MSTLSIANTSRDIPEVKDSVRTVESYALVYTFDKATKVSRSDELWLFVTHTMCVDGVEFDARDGRLGSRRPMHLQTPVFPRLSLVWINTVVLVLRIISRSPRIPYTKLAVFIFAGKHHQPAVHKPKNQQEEKGKLHSPPKKIRSIVGSGWYAALYTLSCVTLALATTFMPRNRSRSASTSAFSFESRLNTKASRSAVRRG